MSAYIATVLSTLPAYGQIAWNFAPVLVLVVGFALVATRRAA